MAGSGAVVNPVDYLAVYVLQAWLLLAGVGILAGRVLRWWRRRRDPWQELARRTVAPK